MSKKDEFEFDLPNKKEKKEKPQREKKEGKDLLAEGKNLFGDGSLLDKLPFKKSSSIDFDISFDKEKKEKPYKEKSPICLQRWHILLIVISSILIVVGIIAAILIGIVNNKVPGGIGGIIEGEDLEEEITEPEGIVSSVGTFLPNTAQEYILCEYTEYFSGEKTHVWKRENDVLFNYNPYYVLVSESGQAYYDYAYEYTGEVSPEQARKDLLAFIQQIFMYTDEQISHYDVHLYQPASFTRVKLSEVTLTETDVTVKYSAGAVDGEMSEEFTLTGTYTKAENDYTFTYPTLPEDAVPSSFSATWSRFASSGSVG